MSTDILKEAAALIRAGKKAEAHELLEPFLKANLHDISAWLLEVRVWPMVEQKKKVLESCLRYNPDSSQILRALAALESIAPSRLNGPNRSPAQDAGNKPSPIPKKTSKPFRTLDKIIVGCAFLAFLILLPAGCIFAAGRGHTQPSCTEPCTRVLFIGNSYTYVNDLPRTFAELAESGRHSVGTGMLAEGGWTLSDHATASKTLETLNSSDWDYVVLQEQSVIPAFEQSRISSMYPAVRLLVSHINEAGATPVLFETWAHRDGMPEYGLGGYEAMQFQIDQGYRSIAMELDVSVAPVGEAWLSARRQNPERDLWQTDGSHPNEQGTYLAACVFYAAIFRESPEGLTYRSRISKETAQGLQTIAAETVLGNPWNHGTASRAVDSPFRLTYT